MSTFDSRDAALEVSEVIGDTVAEEIASDEAGGVDGSSYTRVYENAYYAAREPAVEAVYLIALDEAHRITDSGASYREYEERIEAVARRKVQERRKEIHEAIRSRHEAATKPQGNQ